MCLNFTLWNQVSKKDYRWPLVELVELFDSDINHFNSDLIGSGSLAGLASDWPRPVTQNDFGHHTTAGTATSNVLVVSLVITMVIGQCLIPNIQYLSSRFSLKHWVLYQHHITGTLYFARIPIQQWLALPQQAVPQPPTLSAGSNIWSGRQEYNVFYGWSSCKKISSSSTVKRVHKDHHRDPQNVQITHVYRGGLYTTLHAGQVQSHGKYTPGDL